ncbi:hypothetical protein [Pseudopedobacter beijingensis]|uniref:Uncharacterized protein n=1 Tax=Pseudopedobacter beijingensis TaxID=1207056 RepID=A0ABW4II24_9SPHI
MFKEKNISSQIREFEDLEKQNLSLDSKLDELLKLLDNSELDSDRIKHIQNKFNAVVEKKLSQDEAISEIKEISLQNIDQLDKLNRLEVLLNNNYIDSKQAKGIKRKELLGKAMQILIGFLMVTLGFAMVILPAPPYFEMFTIFHFTYDDGFTLMDLISLIIIATGIYLIIKSYYKFSKE